MVKLECTVCGFQENRFTHSRFERISEGEYVCSPRCKEIYIENNDYSARTPDEILEDIRKDDRD